MKKNLTFLPGTIPAILALLFCVSQNAQGQTTSNLQTPTSVNASGAAPDASAMLDVQSTTQGMLVPRMTSGQRTGVASPATGLLVFDVDTGSFWFFDGANWADLSANMADADGDTKIQVEAAADQDIIRFGAGGNERLRIATDSSTFEGKVRVAGAFVSGHPANNAAGPDAFIGGGSFNTALANSASVSGGDLNTASGTTSFVGGGSNNSALGNNSFVGGGNENRVFNFRDFIGGGFMNTASGGSAFIGGGFLNTATGQGSFVAGGLSNSTAGASSFASGEGAKAKSYGEAAFGLHNTDYTPVSTTTFEATDRLFVIGNGMDALNPSDALVMLKNGHLGIGTNMPAHRLHISGGHLAVQGDQAIVFGSKALTPPMPARTPSSFWTVRSTQVSTWAPNCSSAVSTMRPP